MLQSLKIHILFISSLKKKISKTGNLDLEAVNHHKVNTCSIVSYLIFASALLASSFCYEHDLRIEETTIDLIHKAFAENKLTSRKLVDFYLGRIESLNPELCSVVEVHSEARDQADEADLQFKFSDQNLKVLGSLHGIPALLRDSISGDASIVEKLRKAGALILGKVSPPENSVCNSLQDKNDCCTKDTVNPYLATGDPCGSSSGAAISVAANMAVVSLATEVDGSIACSADRNSVVGIKPTVGLTSRAGIPSLPTRLGTVGPVARTVSDAVMVLDAIVGHDLRDPEATREAVRFIPKGGYKQFLNKDGMKGQRIAIIRTAYLESFPKDSVTSLMFEEHMETLRQRGAIIVDNVPADYTDLILNPNQSSEASEAQAKFNVILGKFMDDINSPPSEAPESNSSVDTSESELTQLAIKKMKTIEINEELIKVLDMAKNVSSNAFEKLMSACDLDVVVTLGQDAYKVLGITGYPGITVPAGYEVNGGPFGICFSGLRGSEPTLIQVAYGFEQATNIRRPPNLSKIFKIDAQLYLPTRKFSNGSFSVAFPGSLTENL